MPEISDDDLLSIVLPKGLSPQTRKRVEEQLKGVLAGEARFSKFAKSVITGLPSFPVPPARKSHCALV